MMVVLALLCAAPPLPTPPAGLSRLTWEAERITPTLRSPLAKAFVSKVPELPAPGARTLYRSADKQRYLTEAAWRGLGTDEQKSWTPQPIDELSYYTTRYGTPLSYARPLEILGEHGVKTVAGQKILDFGYGYVGHLRLLAALGADVHGVDVDPMLAALYSEPRDTGVIPSRSGPSGRVTLHQGRFPTESALVQAVGREYQLIISKNVLKRGYIHPERPADPKHLIDLGVSDEVFLAAMFRALSPGGKLLIFNICPAMAPPDRPFIPWADGRSPFSKEAWQKAGFKILRFDEVDTAAVRAQGRTLGWDLPEDGEPGMDLERDLFAWYTLVEKPR
ncbi:MAG: class I SAM-dependent methyltransferase [Deltaproteobacteria bacterium]|nr:class I SAM-dependent methyltransferase [Deltaproteobacteria bacterium]